MFYANTHKQVKPAIKVTAPVENKLKIDDKPAAPAAPVVPPTPAPAPVVPPPAASEPVAPVAVAPEASVEAPAETEAPKIVSRKKKGE